jgi:hypothetical protein
MLRASLRAELPASDLGLLLELGYVPPLTSERGLPNLRARATGLRLGFAGSAHFGWLDSLGIDVALGVALERVSVTPLSGTTSVREERSVSHIDPLFFARVGPTLALSARLRLVVSVGAELLTVARRYGYTADTNLEVLALDRARATALAELGFLL